MACLRQTFELPSVFAVSAVLVIKRIYIYNYDATLRQTLNLIFLQVLHSIFMDLTALITSIFEFH